MIYWRATLSVPLLFWLSKTEKEEHSSFNNSPGLTTKITHRVDIGNAKPVKHSPYHYFPKVLEAMQNEPDSILQKGSVELC